MASRFIFEAQLPYFVESNGQRTQLFMEDKELGFRNKPNFDGWLIAPEYKTRILTNGLGFREAEHFMNDKGDKSRIIAFGDSFTFGIGVKEEETYTKTMERCLNKTEKTPVEALNFGVGAYGTIQEFITYKRYEYLKPDLIIIGFLARNTFAEEGGNDLIDNYNFYKKSILGDRQYKSYLPLQRKIRTFLRNHSNLYRILELKFGGYLRAKYSPDDVNLQLKDEAWRVTNEYLHKFDYALKKDGIKGLLLWIPFPGTISSGDFTVLETLKQDKFDNLTIVSPVDKLRVDPAQYYYPLDGHWKKETHKIVGNLLCEEITKRHLLQTAPKTKVQ
jgi:hypothetical protein